jgi:hydroxymethylpyrimidine kinase/phosphomethylpyrimidine kinase
MRTSDPPVVLSIAGFDPSGGAGIIADVKTIVQFGCRPAAAITSLTFQNADGFFGATHESAKSLRAQIIPTIAEHAPSAVKVGMLPTAGLVSEVAQLILEKRLPPPVVDPVLESSSGARLMEPGAIEALTRELMPLLRLVTPNIPEAEALTGTTIANEEGMRDATAMLREMGARAVLIKGGHAWPKSAGKSQQSEGRLAVDVLNDDGEVTVFRGEWIDAPPVRGTGCMMSSAIAACLAQRITLPESVRLAKRFVADAIRYAPKLGPDPVTLEIAELIRSPE